MLQMLSLILSVMSVASIGWSSHAVPPRLGTPTAASVDGRLGGSRATFDEAYADQQPEVTGSGTLFSFDDLGLFLVNFQARTIHSDPKDVAAVIVISAPRDPTRAANEPDRDDWTTDDALATAHRFLPRDATVETDGDDPAQPGCHSDALAETDFGGGAGNIGCQITFIQPTPDTVSYMTLSLSDPQTTEDRHDPCAEMSEWGQATGANMAEAEKLIASIQDLDLTADDAATQLGDIASGLQRLADAQRELVAPAPAARAQQSLTEALDAYVDALNLAANGIESSDDDLLNQAVALVTTARNDYATADDRVLLALQACSLAEVGT